MVSRGRKMEKVEVVLVNDTQNLKKTRINRIILMLLSDDHSTHASIHFDIEVNIIIE